MPLFLIWSSKTFSCKKVRWIMTCFIHHKCTVSADCSIQTKRWQYLMYCFEKLCKSLYIMKFWTDYKEWWFMHKILSNERYVYIYLWDQMRHGLESDTIDHWFCLCIIKLLMLIKTLTNRMDCYQIRSNTKACCHMMCVVKQFSVLSIKLGLV